MRQLTPQSTIYITAEDKEVPDSTVIKLKIKAKGDKLVDLEPPLKLNDKPFFSF